MGLGFLGRMLLVVVACNRTTAFTSSHRWPIHCPAVEFTSRLLASSSGLEGVESLVESLLSIDVDEVRRAMLQDAVNGWAQEKRAELVDSFSRCLAARGQALQVEGKDMHERGEDTKPLEGKLWKIVDMTVGVRVMVKRAEEGDVA